MAELVTKNYADVIFGLAREKGNVEEIGAELSSIAEILDHTPEFMTFLTSPQILKEEKLNLLENVFQGKVEDMTLNFLKVLVDNRRSQYLPEIARSYKTSQREFLGIEYVEAITALPMDEDQVSKLISTLEAKTGKKIELNNVIDSDIIGGMKIRIGERSIDGTVRSRLEELQSEISK